MSHPIIDLYREALKKGIAPCREELKAAFKALGGGFERSVFSPYKDIVCELGFGLPSAEVIESLASHGPMLEIAAGSRIWSRFLSEAGCDVVAIDIGCGSYGADVGIGRHHKVIDMDALDAIERFPGRTVLMV